MGEVAITQVEIQYLIKECASISFLLFIIVIIIYIYLLFIYFDGLNILLSVPTSPPASPSPLHSPTVSSSPSSSSYTLPSSPKFRGLRSRPKSIEIPTYLSFSLFFVSFVWLTLEIAMHKVIILLVRMQYNMYAFLWWFFITINSNFL